MSTLLIFLEMCCKIGLKVIQTKVGVCFNLDLAVLGCDVSAETMDVVGKVIEDLRRRINLSGNPPVENYSPVDIKSYLMTNSLRFCVLVVDRYSTERKLELEEIVTKAADVVGKKGLCLDTKY